MGTGWFCSCTPLVTPGLQQHFGDCSKIILSVTGTELSSLDPWNSQFWPSQHSLAGSSAGRSNYFCLLCLFVLESWKQSVMCVVWAVCHLILTNVTSLCPGPSVQLELRLFRAPQCGSLPASLSLSLPSSPLSAAFLGRIFTGTFHQTFFFANAQGLDLIHYPCLRSDSSW